MDADDDESTNSYQAIAEDEQQKQPEIEQQSERHPIDISSGATSMWLVKVPAFLMQEWQSAPAGSTLGSINIEHMQSDTVPNVSLQLDSSSQLPKHYQVKHIGRPESTFAFTEEVAQDPADEAKALSITGTVQFEFHATPVIDDDYRSIMRKRKEMSESGARSTQIIEAKGELQSVQNVSKKFLDSASIQAPSAMIVHKKRRAEDFRRDRLPREELVELLFKAYQKKEHWSLKEIQEVVNQPVAYLKEILAELCVYIPRGPYKNLYQLKAEYKQVGISSTPAPPLDMAK